MTPCEANIHSIVITGPNSFHEGFWADDFPFGDLPVSFHDCVGKRVRCMSRGPLSTSMIVGKVIDGALDVSGGFSYSESVPYGFLVVFLSTSTKRGPPF